MKPKMYISPNGFAYRVAADGQSIQFWDTTQHLGWKSSDNLMYLARKSKNQTFQEVLDQEAARRGWQPWEEGAKRSVQQSKAVQRTLMEERAQVLADQKTAQIQAELAKVRTGQKTSDSQSDQLNSYDAVILATRSMDAAWQAMAPMLSRLAPEEKVPVIYKVVNQLMCMKEEALQMIEKEKKPDADHQN